jgi:hypothetical protein
LGRKLALRRLEFIVIIQVLYDTVDLRYLYGYTEMFDSNVRFGRYAVRFYFTS